MQITTLIENRKSKADSRLASEWGLSLHIKINKYSILFDSGSSGTFSDNAERLDIDMKSVNVAVLSHHHVDHGGGLRKFLECNSIAKVYLGEAPNGDCYAKILGLITKYVGLDKKLFAEYSERFEIVTEPIQILPDVFLVPHISRNHPRPKGNKYIFLKRKDALIFDDFSHEIVMAIKESGKLVIFTGCSHGGVLNMVDTVAQAFKDTPIKAVVGGFHLIGMPPFNFMADSKSAVEQLGHSILNYPIDQAYTGHCTGTQAFRVLKGVMGSRLTDMQTGSCFEV
jgi:7,8-dihydropterin-6-yl-methyl-4-(beta-D-ribofuranosyl)aminobenzene 5'-phosphate synthase